MHEIEDMIRLVLESGPQRGRMVCEWVAEASGYKVSKIYQIAEAMDDDGVLLRGAWALCDGKNSTNSGLRASLKARIPRESPPSLIEALPEIIEREWRELRGETL